MAAEIRAVGRRALAVRCHVGDWDECAALIDATVAEFGRIDVLVNNAGIAPVPPSLLEVTAELFDKTIAVNLKGPLRLTALAAEHMPAGGSIINISSKASLHPTSFTVVYAAAKAGLNALTKAAADEFGPRGIRVNAIVCGTFHTDSFHASIPTPELQAQMAGQRQPGPHRLRRRDRRHRAVPGERRVVVPDRRAHHPRRRLTAPSSTCTRPYACVILATPLVPLGSLVIETWKPSVRGVNWPGPTDARSRRRERGVPCWRRRCTKRRA